MGKTILDYAKSKRVLVWLKFRHRGGRRGGTGFYWLVKVGGEYRSLEDVGKLIRRERLYGRTLWRELWELPIDVTLVRRHYHALHFRDIEIKLRYVVEARYRDMFIEVAEVREEQETQPDNPSENR